MENLNAEREQITSSNSDLYGYVKRIVAAVKYKGECDHEDVPTILREFARGYEQRIKELTDKFEAGNKEYRRLDSEYRSINAKYIKLTEENERLRAERAKFFEYKHGTLVRNALILTKNKKEFDDFCGAIKADTVRKMQERLKQSSEIVYGDRAVCVELIDQIAKEMLEENK